jgi:hypothetical protein
VGVNGFLSTKHPKKHQNGHICWASITTYKRLLLTQEVQEVQFYTCTTKKYDRHKKSVDRKYEAKGAATPKHQFGTTLEAVLSALPRGLRGADRPGLVRFVLRDPGAINWL